MARKRGSRFTKAIDAQEQLESLERAQEARRKGKGKTLVESVGKSRKRLDNTLKQIRTREDSWEEFS